MYDLGFPCKRDFVLKMSYVCLRVSDFCRVPETGNGSELVPIRKATAAAAFLVEEKRYYLAGDPTKVVSLSPATTSCTRG